MIYLEKWNSSEIFKLQRKIIFIKQLPMYECHIMYLNKSKLCDVMILIASTKKNFIKENRKSKNVERVTRWSRVQSPICDASFIDDAVFYHRSYR